MVFTTQIFIFVFLPLCVLCYTCLDLLSKVKVLSRLINKPRLKDLLLIVFSFGFYAWAGLDNVFRLLAYIVIVYLLGMFINYAKNNGKYVLIGTDLNSGEGAVRKFYLSTIPFALVISAVIFVLVYYNYSGFISDSWNKLFGASTQGMSLIAPLGLSFITFSAISYLVDIYRKNTEPGSIIDCALYLTFFPR